MSDELDKVGTGTGHDVDRADEADDEDFEGHSFGTGNEPDKFGTGTGHEPDKFGTGTGHEPDEVGLVGTGD
ncbi:MAG TPA: hypothetical protein VGF10_12940 [Gaiella sp.]